MQIPSEFQCAGFIIKVNIEDVMSSYGTFNDAKNEIKIAKSLDTSEGIVELTQKQMFNSFAHELIHCFQFYYDNSDSESQAQVYANFLCEFFRSVESEDEY